MTRCTNERTESWECGTDSLNIFKVVICVEIINQLNIPIPLLYLVVPDVSILDAFAFLSLSFIFGFFNCIHIQLWKTDTKPPVVHHRVVTVAASTTFHFGMICIPPHIACVQTLFSSLVVYAITFWLSRDKTPFASACACMAGCECAPHSTKVFVTIVTVSVITVGVIGICHLLFVVVVVIIVVSGALT
jgi:hypothetical protein